MVSGKILDIRKSETNYFLKGGYLRALNDTIGLMTPLLLAIVIFSVYASGDRDFKPSKVYVVLAYFNLLLVPVRLFMFVLV